MPRSRTQQLWNWIASATMINQREINIYWYGKAHKFSFVSIVKNIIMLRGFNLLQWRATVLCIVMWCYIPYILCIFLEPIPYTLIQFSRLHFQKLKNDTYKILLGCLPKIGYQFNAATLLKQQQSKIWQTPRMFGNPTCSGW